MKIEINRKGVVKGYILISLCCYLLKKFVFIKTGDWIEAEKRNIFYRILAKFYTYLLDVSLRREYEIDDFINKINKKEMRRFEKEKSCKKNRVITYNVYDALQDEHNLNKWTIVKETKTYTLLEKRLYKGYR